MHIIQPTVQLSGVEYHLSFAHRTAAGAGFSFPCDVQGHVDESALLHSAARENLRKCLDGSLDVEPKGIVEIPYTYTEPAIGRCNYCHYEVVLIDHTNACDTCGAEYNMCGQELTRMNPGISRRVGSQVSAFS